jgi:hypothetical protein
LQEPLGERLGRLGGAVEELAQRRVVDRDAGATVGLGLAIQGERVGALGDHHLGHEGRAEAGLVVDLGRRVGGDDGFAAATAELLLDVNLPLDLRRDELVHLGDLALAEPTEVLAAAPGTGLLLLPDLVLDLPGDELALLLGVLPSLLERGDPGGLGLGGVAELLRHRRHLLGARAEDVPLELLQRALHGHDLLAQRGDRCGGLGQLGGRAGELFLGLPELRLQGFGPVAPLATVIVTAHRRS